MGQQMPRTINLFGRPLNYAGKGRAPGSESFMDLAGGVVHEMYPADVISTGSLYSLVLAQRNQALGAIRVDRSVLLSSGVGTVHIGNSLLVGPLEFGAIWPTARGAWRLASAPNPGGRTVPTNGVGRRTGFMKSIHTTGVYAFLAEEPSGMEIFGHKNHLRPGVFFAIGRRYSFILGNNHKGAAAFDIAFA
jgi:hypothetical protein